MSAKHRRKPYMPDSDIGKRVWMERFITTLESDPQRYGFGPPTDPRMFECTQRTIRTFIEASAAAGPGVRSPSLTREKNNARKAAVNMCREIAMRLKWDPSLTVQEKINLGICAVDSAAEKAKVPEGALPGTSGFPQLNVLSSPSGGHVIRYKDLTTSKAKPRGVSHFMLYAAIGDKPNLRKTHARLLGAYTRRPFEIMYPMGCGLEGLYVTYYGRWLTTRGELSPWSRPVSKMIGDTQVSLAECAFAHLFEATGFIDAVPQLPADVKRIAAQHEMRIVEDRPLLEGVANEGTANVGAGLFAALEAKLEAATVRLLNAA